MFGLGPSELIIVAVIVLVLFGAKRLPDIGKGLGGALREFRAVKKEISGNKEGPEEVAAKKSTPEEGAAEKKDPLESKVTEKVLEQVPGVKKAVDAKKKADKIKEILS